MTSIETTRTRLADIIESRNFLERRYRDTTDAEFVMCDPTPERLASYGMRPGRF